MRLAEIRELLQFRPIEWDATTRRLDRCLTIEDLRRLARRRLPGVVFDYIDGGAEDEVTLAENRAAFVRWQFVPQVLQDVSVPDLSAPFFGGRRYDIPLALCPTGYTRMTHPERGGGRRGCGAKAQHPLCLVHGREHLDRGSPRGAATATCGSSSTCYATEAWPGPWSIGHKRAGTSCSR